MRQVPHYLLIGSGRLATHFAHYFSLLKISYSQWSRRNNTLSDLLLLCDRATHLLFLVSDSAIPKLVAVTEDFNYKIRIHCSGLLVLQNISSAHPLMTFSHQLYAHDFYRSIPFIIETEGPEFSELLPGLSNPNYKIPAALKDYYHTMCVISGNFTTILWQKFFYELKHKFNLPIEIAQPYLKQITANLITNPQAALTGPLVRNDYATITANLSALENDAFQEIYEAFTNVFSTKTVR